MKDSFIFYRSFFESITVLEDTDRLAMFDAICNLALNQEQTELKPLPNAMFTLIKPQIDANNRRFNNGKKGGRPKAKNNLEETKDKPKDNLDKSKPKPNDNVNVNDNVNKNKTKNDFDLFIEYVKANATTKSKVTITKETKKLYKAIADKNKLALDYLQHQADKKEFAQRLTPYLLDYNPIADSREKTEIELLEERIANAN